MEIAAVTSKPRGRPRAFDRDAALDIAMRLFWTRGFEAVSIHDLEAALGIAAPSLYAAFGDKKRLFREAIDRYCAGPGNLVGRSMTGKTTAFAAVEALLLCAAEAYTEACHPPGCMVIHAGTNCSSKSDDIAAELADIRRKVEAAIADRLAAGQVDGDLPHDVNTLEMAAFFASVVQGMSTQARDGATSEMLRAVARQAMRCWPAEGR
jgi:TetR/AcrR family transcriptional regulator, copper-responsive repressor